MTSKAYQIGEADKTWLDTGGTELLTLTSLGAGAGRQGAQHDFGDITVAKAYLFDWTFFCKFAGAPVVNERLDVYWKGWHQGGTHAMNDDGVADAALSSPDKLKNLKFLGSLVIDEANATPEFVAMNKGEPVWLPHRYGCPVIFNNSQTALSATAAEHGFILTPIALQAQDT